MEPGGAQLSVLRVVRALTAWGIRSRVLVGWASPPGLALAARMGVEVEVFGRAGELQWRADPHFAAWLAPRLSGVRVVHAHMFGAWWAAAQVVREGTALVASEHNALLWPGEDASDALGDALARVDRFYAHGPGARRSVLEAGLPADRLREGLSPITGMGSSALAGLPVPRLVTAGRLHPEKGLDVLLDALALLHDAPPTLVLGEGGQRAQLEAQVRRLGLGHRVRLLGWQEHPGRFVAGAAALVVPSRDEAWSQAAVLAMGLGVPVIGTDVDGLPLTLGAGRGIVVPAEDPAALAGAVAGVLDGSLRSDLLAARAYAVRHTPRRVARAYATAYRELAASASPARPSRAA